jgi:tetratricopeptide (TPR) repeat protein
MSRTSIVAAVSCAALCLVLSPVAGAHDEAPTGKPPEQLGKVSFEVSCNAAAQQEFNRAMALFHSFWFEPAKRSFTRVLELDPQCGMAYWGISIMSMGNPFTWAANPGASKGGAPAYDKAAEVGAKSERERDYIAALGAFFKDWQTVEFQPRALAFEKAMAGVAAKYPADDEGQILYALALNITALPTDKTFANQAKAAAILEPLFKKYPDHPGVAHYLIHTYDYADLASRGLASADAYGKIAPSVPHALHMPSHIYARVGRWPEMVEGNRASYLAAKAELKDDGRSGIAGYDALHAMDYLVYAELQLAQDKAARKLLDEAQSIRKVNVENFPAIYALAAIPARYAIERGDWAQAAGLRLVPSGLTWDKFPQAEAVLVFARALGAARSGQIDAARADVGRLGELKRQLLASNNTYWAAQANFQIQAVQAWIAHAEGRNDEALALMRTATEAEGASDKHPVTPGNVIPSRELLGDMLLELGRPADALAEFEHSLQRDPQRLHGLYGAARSAEAAGDRVTSREYYAALAALTAEHDTDRPELVRARAWLAKIEVKKAARGARPVIGAGLQLRSLLEAVPEAVAARRV